MITEKTVLTVSEVNNYVKACLSRDENLRHLSLKGEISNFKIYPSGHIYFSLKDNDSVISAVMFANAAKNLIFVPKNGDEVLVNASLDVYAPRGQYQLTVYEMEEVGQGLLLVELEKLKKQLASEGLFDESRKRKINLYPKMIGVITAPNGAAVRDIVTNIKRRYPLTDILIFPSSVQGENAPKELLKAFQISQTYPLDTLIIGRGGGASEDLSAFNDEMLVRAIAKSKMPVIAAVGHEIDSTFVDYVADKRASTPTGAAELATIDRREIEQTLDQSLLRMQNSLKTLIINQKEDVQLLKDDLETLIHNQIDKSKNELKNYQDRLKALSPKGILKRGYAIIEDEHHKPIVSVNDVVIGQKIKTVVSDGEYIAIVEEKQNGK